MLFWLARKRQGRYYNKNRWWERWDNFCSNKSRWIKSTLWRILQGSSARNRLNCAPAGSRLTSARLAFSQFRLYISDWLFYIRIETKSKSKFYLLWKLTYTFIKNETNWQPDSTILCNLYLGDVVDHSCYVKQLPTKFLLRNLLHIRTWQSAHKHESE